MRSYKPFALLFLLALAACDRSDKITPVDPGKGDSVAHIDSVSKAPKTVSGILRYADGRPAVGATIKIYAIDYVPGDGAAAKTSAAGVFSTRTDTAGRYAVDSLPAGAGEYNILGEKEDLKSYQDSVYLSATPKDLDPDTLLTAGYLSGRVVLQPNHNLETVTVQALGTNAYANADAEGRFKLGPLAEGRYRLRIVTTEMQYTPFFVPAQVRAGRADTLAQILTPVYTGIPVVTGMAASYDTLSGVVTLTWNTTRYSQFLEYQVYRNLASDLAPSVLPIAKPKDTVFKDTVYRNGRFMGSVPIVPADSQVRVLQYRVRVVDKSDIAGLAFNRLEIAAPSPFFVQASLALDAQDNRTQTSLLDGAASPNDTLRINAYFHDPARRIVRVRFYHGKESLPMEERTIDPPTRSGVASILFVTGKVGADSIRAEAEDDAGQRWSQTLPIPVLQDAPIANAGPDTIVTRNGVAYLNGTGTDHRGRIVKWEWDIGGTGVFHETSGPDTNFTAPGQLDRIPCDFRITDDDGNVAKSRKWINVQMEWRKESTIFPDWPNGIQDHGMESFHGKLWLMGGQTSTGIRGENGGLLAYSEDGLSWTRVVPDRIFSGRWRPATAVYDNKLWLFGGTVLGGKTATDGWISENGMDWTQVTESGYPDDQGGAALVAFHGRLWCIGGYSSTDNPAGTWYSEDGKTWSQPISHAPLKPIYYHRAVVYDDKIWVIGGVYVDNQYHNPDIWVSEDGANWQKLPQNPAIAPLTLTIPVDYGGWLWLIGGRKCTGPNVYCFDAEPNNKNWYSRDGVSWQAADPSPALGGNGQSVTVFQDKIWIHFGQTAQGELPASAWSGR